jgi:hypothetical protein
LTYRKCSACGSQIPQQLEHSFMPRGVCSNMEGESVYTSLKGNGLICKYKLIDYLDMK